MCHGEKSRAEAEQLGGRGTGVLNRAVGVRRCLSSETFEQRPEGGEDDSQGGTGLCNGLRAGYHTKHSFTTDGFFGIWRTDLGVKAEHPHPHPPFPKSHSKSSIPTAHSQTSSFPNKDTD